LKTSKRLLGDRGEDVACHFYASNGYDILERNVFIAQTGEIDLVASRVINGMTTYVFVEVKTRSSSRYGTGFEAISFDKKVRMRSCALAWLQNNKDSLVPSYQWRLDVCSVTFEQGEPYVEIIENIEF
jgi:putative endonuclease